MMNTQSMLGQLPPEMSPGVAQPEPPIDAMPDMDDPMGEGSEEESLENWIDYALSSTNIAKRLQEKDPALLDEIGATIKAGYEADEQSREEWMKNNEESLKLALLTRETKTYPWPKASNVKYPLIATAAMQFSARAYPALVPSDGNIVKTKVVRKDKQGLFQQKAIRVALHMSYQVMNEIPNWEEEMDKLLMTMAISGICFKETFHDPILKKHISQIVYPEDLCVNYWAKSLDKAYRKTRILHYTENDVKAKQMNDEVFLDIELSKPSLQTTEDSKPPIVSENVPVADDAATPMVFLACHTYWDLDDDGYEEPYIITVHKDSGKVVRIIARWDSDGVTYGEKNKILHIKPVEYFTLYSFIPNPDGSIYALGFGSLLGPLNESVNTLINQLVDAGTLNNLQGGFIGKNLRIKMGNLQLRPGEWKVVNASGEDMQKSFYPNPSKDPSPVLYQLMNTLVTSGNQLASIAEIFVGKMPGQNTPATTTQEAVQQGMAVFTAIYKRVYRSLEQEFKKIFRLNRIVPDMLEREMYYSGEQLQESDYVGTEDYIIPGADPSGDSAAMRSQKMQAVGGFLQLGTIDPMAYTVRSLKDMDLPNYEELIAQPQPPQPDPEQEAKAAESQAKMQLLERKGQIDERKAQMDMAAKEKELELKEKLAEIDRMMKQQEMQFKQQMQAIELQGKRQEKQMDMVMQTIEQHFKQQQMQGEMRRNEVMGQHEMQMEQVRGAQEMRHAEDSHQMNMKQAKETSKMKQQQSRNNGNKQR